MKMTGTILLTVRYLVIYSPKPVVFQRLKAAVHYTVGKICEDELAQECDVTFSKGFIAALAETAFDMSELWGQDLAAFAS